MGGGDNEPTPKIQGDIFLEVGPRGWPWWPSWPRAKSHASAGAPSRSSAAMRLGESRTLPPSQRLHGVFVHWPRVWVGSRGMATMATVATLN